MISLAKLVIALALLASLIGAMVWVIISAPLQSAVLGLLLFLGSVAGDWL